MSHGISKLGCTKVIEHCHSKVAYEVYMNTLDVNESNMMKKDFDKNPEKYNHWKGGPYWNSDMKLNNFIDVLMHLLFLGITKSAREFILLWFVELKRMPIY